MMSIKVAIQYLLIIIGLLLAIWSQCWLMTTVVFISAVLSWQASARQFIKAQFQKVSKRIARTLEWLMALSIALFFIWFANKNLLSFYSMSSNSMSPTHSINELIVINKLEYGAACNPNNVDKFKRTRGFSEPRHGDVIAFHFPEADTSFIEHVQENYYFLKRQFEITQIPNPLLNEKTHYEPVSERKIFIKRLIGLPGDTLKIINGDYYINDQTLKLNELNIGRFEIRPETPADTKEKIRKSALTTFSEFGTQQVEIQHQIIKEKGWDNYLIRKEETMNMPNPYVFPFKASYFWNASYLGPIILPTKNKTVRLTLNNLPLYKRIIEAYEGNTMTVKGESIYINNKKSNEYTFKLNYYWVGGDNIKHSFDSRYWGFVPENHIIGRVEKLSANK